MASIKCMKSVLVDYLSNTGSIMDKAAYLEVEPELVAEIYVKKLLETKEGAELYKAIIEEHRKLVNN